MYLGHVKYLFFWSYFNQTLISSTDVWKIFKHKISCKSIRWQASCSVQADGWMNVLHLIAAFHNIVKYASKHNYKLSVLFYVYVYGSVHRWSILITVRDATQSSLFIILQVHSTCFRCQPHPIMSTQNCNYSLWYRSYFFFFAAAPLQCG